MNQLFHGDNLAILREMPDASVDLICTDPPFNTRKVMDGSYHSASKCLDISYNDKSDYIRPVKSFSNICEEWHEQNKGSEFYFLHHFCSPSELYYFFDMIPILKELKRVLKVGGALYWHCDYRTNSVYRIIMNLTFGDRGCFRNEIIWYNPNKSPMPTLKARFSNNYNNILFYSKLRDQRFVGDFKLEYELGTKKKMGAVWNIPMAKGRERVGYPTQKPRELYQRMIKASSNQGSTVLDPFAGSGTTLDAAQSLGRQWIGIDQSEEAISVIQRRMEARHGMLLKYELIQHETSLTDN